MTTWVQYLNDDSNHELQFIIKEVKKVLGNYTNIECIVDLVMLATKDRELTISRILHMKKDKKIDQ